MNGLGQLWALLVVLPNEYLQNIVCCYVHFRKVHFGIKEQKMARRSDRLIHINIYSYIYLYAHNA